MRTLLPITLTVVGVVWVVLLLLAPMAPREAALVYRFAAGVCHQQTNRSFHLVGAPLPVCARCFGLYASGAVAAAAAMLSARRGSSLTPTAARLVFAAAAAPTVATVGAEWLGLAAPSNLARALASVPLGAAAGWIFVRMLLVDARRAPPRRSDNLRYHA